MKICLSSSSGGHLDELLNLWDAFKGHDIVIALPFTPTTKNLSNGHRVIFFHESPKPRKHFEKFYYVQLFFYYIYLSFASLKIILTERPDMVIGNGGEATLGLSYIGKLFKVKIVYIESLARIQKLSGTGKLVYPISNLFLVQWPDLALVYKNAKYWGRVI